MSIVWLDLTCATMGGISIIAISYALKVYFRINIKNSIAIRFFLIISVADMIWEVCVVILGLSLSFQELFIW